MAGFMPSFGSRAVPLLRQVYGFGFILQGVGKRLRVKGLLFRA